MKSDRHIAMPKRQSGQVPAWQLLCLTLVLSVAWLLWSGLYKPVLLSLGVVSVAITLVFAVRMKFFDHAEGLGRMALRLPGYWLWLLKEILGLRRINGMSGDGQRHFCGSRAVL